MSPPTADSTKQDDRKASQRRINKPLIEKRRRARINDCLAQLKSIVLEAQESQGPKPSKLEKADILEMTVDFIKKRTNGTSLDKNDTGFHGDDEQQKDYMAGFTGCLSEVSKFLMEAKGVSPELRETVVRHMTEKIRDSNNNVRPIQETTTKQTVSEKLPIPRDPTQSVIENKATTSVKPFEKDAKIELTKCANEKVKTEFNAQLDLNNLQNYTTGILPGSQVLVVLQLPPTHNTFLSNPTALPLNTATQNFNNTVTVLEGSSINNVIDLSKPNAGINRIVLNPHVPTQQTLEDPAAILSTSFPACDMSTTMNEQNVQTLPLNLCTNSQHRLCAPDSDPWRPW